MEVRAKKHLGQHFLTDLNIARKIVDALPLDGLDRVLEIGPGMGVLTQFLREKTDQLKVAEIDHESVAYLRNQYPEMQDRILDVDFLKADLTTMFNEEPFKVIGNFPYNISSQILFRIIEHRALIPMSAGMFQKEVAERVIAPHGNKTYGILSVMVQAYYDVEYLFTVGEKVFNPPPKVKSAVIRLSRRESQEIECDESLFRKVVKTSFNQRRKTLRNSLKPLLGDKKLPEDLGGMRPEQLTVSEFRKLTATIQG